MNPKWLLPVADGSVETDEVDTRPADDIKTCEALLNSTASRSQAPAETTARTSGDVRQATSKKRPAKTLAAGTDAQGIRKYFKTAHNDPSSPVQGGHDRSGQQQDRSSRQQDRSRRQSASREYWVWHQWLFLHKRNEAVKDKHGATVPMKKLKEQWMKIKKADKESRREFLGKEVGARMGRQGRRFMIVAGNTSAMAKPRGPALLPVGRLHPSVWKQLMRDRERRQPALLPAGRLHPSVWKQLKRDRERRQHRRQPAESPTASPTAAPTPTPSPTMPTTSTSSGVTRPLTKPDVQCWSVRAGLTRSVG